MSGLSLPKGCRIVAEPDLRMVFGDRAAPLSDVMTRVLHAFMAHGTEVITCTELAAKVYEGRDAPAWATTTIKVTIHRMRQRCLAAGIDINIKSLRGRKGGYSFVGIGLCKPTGKSSASHPRLQHAKGGFQVWTN